MCDAINEPLACQLAHVLQAQHSSWRHGAARHRPHRACEVNARLPVLTIAIKEALGALIGAVEYVAITFGQNRNRAAWTPAQRHARVVFATPAFTTRSPESTSALEGCDFLIFNAEADLAGARNALLMELSSVLQHTAPRASMAIYGVACRARPLGTFHGPFWLNATEPCWQERFDAIAATSLEGAQCEPLAESVSGHEGRLCSGAYAAHRSACMTQPPLLETWNERRASETAAAEAAASPTMASSRRLSSRRLSSLSSSSRSASCVVRKELVTLGPPSSWLWKQATHDRATLNHLYRRHLRYYSAFDCNGEPGPNGTGWPAVCLLFKDEITEEWVAGLSSSDGLSFPGDPALVMPRVPLRSAQPAAFTSPSSFIRVGALRGPPASPITNVAARAAAESYAEGKLVGARTAARNMRRRAEEWAAAKAAAEAAAEHGALPAGRRLLRARMAAKAAAATAAAAVGAGAGGEGGGAGGGGGADGEVVYRVPTRLSLAEAVHLQASSMTHNLALMRHGGVWYAIGGRHNRNVDLLSMVSPLRAEAEDRALWQRLHVSPNAFGAPRLGLWMVRGPSWRFDAAHGTPAAKPWLSLHSGVEEPPATQWSDKRLLFDGRQPGCVDRRTVGSGARKDMMRYLLPGGVCEFDGRLSLVHFKGEFLVFARANPAHSGRRHVQVTRSRSDPFEAPASPSSGVSERWAPFEMLQIDGYDGSGDVYFFGAQVNPSHNGSLLAVFPLVHRLRACLGIAASVDSVRWSRVTPLLSCQLYGERTMDQPAVPSMVRRGGLIWLYVQEEVPGITIDRLTWIHQKPQLLKHERPSRVVRYAFPCMHLARWTEAALRALHRGGGGKRSTRAPFVHSCGAAAAADGVEVPPPPPPSAAPPPRGGRTKRLPEQQDACKWTGRGPRARPHAKRS